MNSPQYISIINNPYSIKTYWIVLSIDLFCPFSTELFYSSICSAEEVGQLMGGN